MSKTRNDVFKECIKELLLDTILSKFPVSSHAIVTKYYKKTKLRKREDLLKVMSPLERKLCQ